MILPKESATFFKLPIQLFKGVSYPELAFINPIHQSLPKKNRKLPNQRKPKNQQMKNATITMILTTTMRIEIWIMTTMSL